MSDKRIPWDQYFMAIVDVVATRATCDRGKSGAVIVKDKQIVSTGYVGSPSGMVHCDEVGHLFYRMTIDKETKEHCGRTIHAEMNAIAQAAKNGISTNGAIMYCSMTPCWDCGKLIVQSGIIRAVCKNDYHASQRTKDLFWNTGIALVIMDESLTY